MSIWNRVQQISENSFAFRPLDVDLAAERSARMGARRSERNESGDDFEELLPTGD